MRIGQSAGKSYEYLLGVYLGDGCITRPYKHSEEWCFKLNTIDKDFAEAVRTALECELTDMPVSISKHNVKNSKRPNYTLYCRCHNLCVAMKEHCGGGKLWPNDIDVWSRPCKLSFIEGLMDSEGFVAANSNPTNRRYYMGYKSCDPWVPELVTLMESVGIRTGKLSTEKPRKPGYKTPRRFHIKMQSWVDSGARFNIARKQDRVDAWASSGPYEKRARHPRRLSSETNTPDTQSGEDRVRTSSERTGGEAVRQAP